jgi:uncharacterized protein YecA (UPF0149 family)
METFDEFESLLSWVCTHNSKSSKKDQIIVDFDTGYCDYSTKRKTQTIGRNDYCQCGSGKKYKKCCMK